MEIIFSIMLEPNWERKRQTFVKWSEEQNFTHHNLSSDFYSTFWKPGHTWPDLSVTALRISFGISPSVGPLRDLELAGMRCVEVLERDGLLHQCEKATGVSFVKECRVLIPKICDE